MAGFDFFGNKKQTTSGDPAVSGDTDRGAVTAGEPPRKLSVGLLVVLALAVLLIVNIPMGNRPTSTVERPTPVIRPAPVFTPPPIPVPAPPPPQQSYVVPAPIPQVPIAPNVSPVPPKPTPIDPHAWRRSSGSVIVKGDQNEATAPAGTVDEGNELQRSLRQTKTPKVVASRMKDTRLMTAKGTPTGDCVLLTRISTEVAGSFTCMLVNNLHSHDGKVVLLPKGTLIFNEYQQRLVTGADRILALAATATTPDGVEIDLDSLVTDRLGGAGVDGTVDRKFWQKYGPALMLSLAGDVSVNFAKQWGSSGGGNAIALPGLTQAPRTAASIAAEGTQGIRPVLTKDQGEVINIMIVRPLDFRKVYLVRSADDHGQ